MLLNIVAIIVLLQGNMNLFNYKNETNDNVMDGGFDELL